MSKLAEFKNEKAAELLADLIEPASALFGDSDIKEALKESGKIAAVKVAMKKHSKELIDILAIIDGVPREEYDVNAMQIVAKTLEILSDSDLMSAFSLQEQTAAE